MRIAYFDCFSGASGDMILGACLDAGLDLGVLEAELAKLPVAGYRLTAEKVRKQGFAATQFNVQLDESTDQPHRHLKHVRDIIEQAQLSGFVRSKALAVFTRLAEAEAAAHGTTIEKVHFHEVGAVDAIVDIVGACVAMEQLGVGRVVVSPMVTGAGTVKCQHGLMPIPAPATAALLTGVPLADCDETGELTTPTGAALLTTLGERFGPLPAMRIERIGVGAGRRDGQHRPNVLRLILGDAAGGQDQPGDAEEDEILVLEANLDDVSAEVVGYVYDRLFRVGALDVFTSPIYMKKNRPGTRLTVLAPPAVRDAVEEVLFTETTTFGVRSHLAQRRKLSRTVETVATAFGPVRVKVGRRGDKVVTVAPEYDDCQQAAERMGRPLREVMEQVTQAWWEGKQT